jgi:hypothetical protein
LWNKTNDVFVNRTADKVSLGLPANFVAAVGFPFKLDYGDGSVDKDKVRAMIISNTGDIYVWSPTNNIWINQTAFHRARGYPASFGSSPSSPYIPPYVGYYTEYFEKRIELWWGNDGKWMVFAKNSSGDYNWTGISSTKSAMGIDSGFKPFVGHYHFFESAGCSLTSEKCDGSIGLINSSRDSFIYYFNVNPGEFIDKSGSPLNGRPDNFLPKVNYYVLGGDYGGYVAQWGIDGKLLHWNASANTYLDVTNAKKIPYGFSSNFVPDVGYSFVDNFRDYVSPPPQLPPPPVSAGSCAIYTNASDCNNVSKWTPELKTNVSETFRIFLSVWVGSQAYCSVFPVNYTTSNLSITTKNITMDNCGCSWNGTTCNEKVFYGVTRPCPVGSTLCADGMCRESCLTVFCNNNGTCESNEGCTCADCNNKQASCMSGLVCTGGLCRSDDFIVEELRCFDLGQANCENSSFWGTSLKLDIQRRFPQYASLNSSFCFDTPKSNSSMTITGCGCYWNTNHCAPKVFFTLASSTGSVVSECRSSTPIVTNRCNQVEKDILVSWTTSSYPPGSQLQGCDRQESIKLGCPVNSQPSASTSSSGRIILWIFLILILVFLLIAGIYFLVNYFSGAYSRNSQKRF